MSEDHTDTEIRPLDQATVERIAAGEVVERPASAVKELVENSVDADASMIDVEVTGDGTERLRVRDDGTGMTEADVRAAVKEHTTSKITDIADLEAGVDSLGFRGEALHTIGAVSKMTIRTKPRGTDDAGTELQYEGGEVVSVEPAGCPTGTTVEVEDLFYNTPARKKYLKQEATEFAHINRIVSRYALANPNVAVSLEHDGRETFSTTGRGDLRETVMSVYGRDVAEAMIPVGAGEPEGTVPAEVTVDASADFPDGPLSGIAGYVSHPETNRASKEYVASFVNGRWVDTPVVREAVLEAYGGQLAADRYPFTTLFLRLPAEAVDVNVHPRKMAIRFNQEDAVRNQVRTAVRAALLDHGLVRTSAPRGRSAPDETTVGPDTQTTGAADDHAVTDSDIDPNSGADSDIDATTGAGPAPSSDASLDPTTSPEPESGPESTSSTATVEETPTAGSGDADLDTDPTTADPDPDPGSGAPSASDPAPAENGPSDTGTTSDPTRATHGDRSFVSETEQRTLGGTTATADRNYDHLPSMRVLGQVDDTYVVAEADDALILIDQHAADERVNYERLRAAFDAGTTVQSLAHPVEVNLTAGEAATFRAARDALSNLGFEAELDETTDGDGSPDTEHQLRVTAVPAVFDHTIDPEKFREVLAAVVDGNHAGETVDALADEFLADLACYPSITGNTSLSEGDIVDLLTALDNCDNPFACPHGRPVVVEISGEELDDRFERDYPGHSSRRKR